MAEVVGEDEEAVPAVGEASEKRALLLSVMRSSTCRIEGAVTFECKQGKLAQKVDGFIAHGRLRHLAEWLCPRETATFKACLHVLKVYDERLHLLSIVDRHPPRKKHIRPPRQYRNDHAWLSVRLQH